MVVQNNLVVEAAIIVQIRSRSQLPMDEELDEVRTKIPENVLISSGGSFRYIKGSLL